LGFGIRGMRRRAQWIAAHFQLQSTPGQGTKVSVDAPIPPRPTAYHWMKLLWKKRTEH
jgi:glucose-6-phosphate-specific signal transduction histidine kinase